MTESINDRAARLQCALELKDKKRRFRTSEMGVNEAKRAFARLTSVLESNLTMIAANYHRLAQVNIIKQEKSPGHDWHYPDMAEFGLTITGLAKDAQITWRLYHQNSLRDEELSFNIYNGSTFDVNDSYRYKLLEDDRQGYVEYRKNKCYSADELADYILHNYMAAAEKYEPEE